MFPLKRLFIGVELPAPCRDALSDLDPGLPGLRWLPAEQMHLTLSFLGDRNQSQQNALTEGLRAVRVPPFFLPLQGVSSFARGGQPSVVWVGVGSGHPHLFALHKRIQDAILRVGLEADLRPFHPHVTVARAKGISRQMLQPFLRRHRETNFDLFAVNGFALLSSGLQSEGASHHVEYRFDL